MIQPTNTDKLPPASSESQLLEHVLDELKDYAIFTISLDGEILTWNPGVERFLGYREEEFVGENFRIIFVDPELENDAPQQEMNSALLEGRAEDERWHRRKDGSIFWASGVLTLMKEGERPIGYAKILRDQTKRQQLFHQLSVRTGELERWNKELKTFTSVVTHDLNAPLQTVQGYASILKSEKLNGTETVESIQAILNTTRRMLEVMKELSHQAQHFAHPPLKVPCDSEKIVEDVVEDLNFVIRREGKISFEGLPVVWGMKAALRQIFQNLIQNAYKYRSRERELLVHISAEEDEEYVIFRIKDNGKGIADSNLSKVFAGFTRGLHIGAGEEETSSIDQLQNRGLGLATCKKLVERLGGQIWIEPQLQGACFAFSLPHRVDTEIESPTSSPQDIPNLNPVFLEAQKYSEEIQQKPDQ